jgi:hypothetical protein
MNILLLYTLITGESIAQEPLNNSILESKENVSQPVESDDSNSNERSFIENKSTSPANSDQNTNIEGLSPQDNEMIQLMLNEGGTLSDEQRLLSGVENTDTSMSSVKPSSTIGIMANTGSSDLYNFAMGLGLFVLMLFGIVSYFFRRKTLNIPQMRMVTRSMFGSEGSLAIIALEQNTQRVPRYLLLGLNNGAAPRLIMELPSYNEDSETSQPSNLATKSNSRTVQETSDPADIRDVLSRANFSGNSPKKEPLRAVVDNEVSLDDEEFMLEDKDIIGRSSPYRDGASKPNKKTQSNTKSLQSRTSDEEKWLRELQHAMEGNSEE